MKEYSAISHVWRCAALFVVLVGLVGCQTTDGANWWVQDFDKYGKNYHDIPTHLLTPGDSKSSILAAIPIEHQVVRNSQIKGHHVETWMYETWRSTLGPDSLGSRTFLILVDGQLAGWNSSGDISLILANLEKLSTANVNTNDQVAKTNTSKLSATLSNTFPSKPINVRFHPSPTRPDDVAVIIGNADYKKLGRDIPNVTPAYADAEGVKKYFTQALGVREGNIIYLKDATGTQLTGVFGSDKNHKGQLFNWVKAGVSNVYVYYAGHGAPAGEDGSSFLIPSDATAETIELTGYPLATLYKNLGKIPAKSITVILESCFSGASQGGTVISNASPVYLKAKTPMIPSNITVISAGAANQIASWEKDKSHSLFTKYFLKGMSGEGDKAPYGNGDGKVTYGELGKYLEGTMTYFARRYYGRDQRAQIVGGG